MSEKEEQSPQASSSNDNNYHEIIHNQIRKKQKPPPPPSQSPLINAKPKKKAPPPPNAMTNKTHHPGPKNPSPRASRVDKQISAKKPQKKAPRPPSELESNDDKQTLKEKDPTKLETPATSKPTNNYSVDSNSPSLAKPVQPKKDQSQDPNNAGTVLIRNGKTINQSEALHELTNDQRMMILLAVKDGVLDKDQAEELTNDIANALRDGNQNRVDDLLTATKRTVPRLADIEHMVAEVTNINQDETEESSKHQNDDKASQPKALHPYFHLLNQATALDILTQVASGQLTQDQAMLVVEQYIEKTYGKISMQSNKRPSTTNIDTEKKSRSKSISQMFRRSKKKSSKSTSSSSLNDSTIDQLPTTSATTAHVDDEDEDNHDAIILESDDMMMSFGEEDEQVEISQFSRSVTELSPIDDAMFQTVSKTSLEDQTSASQALNSELEPSDDNQEQPEEEKDVQIDVVDDKFQSLSQTDIKPTNPFDDHSDASPLSEKTSTNPFESSFPHFEDADAGVKPSQTNPFA